MKNPHAVILGRAGGKSGTGASKARPTEQARRAGLKSARVRKARKGK